MTATVVGAATTITGGSTLTVEGAQAGDVAALVIGCQYGHIGDMTPEGWAGVYEDGTHAGRSGTVATRLVTGSADAVGVPVPAPVGGRIAAALVVLRGLLSAPTPVGWQTDAPTLPEDGAALVLTQQHGIATAQTITHTPAGRAVVTVDGQRSSEVSWSAVTAALVDDCHGETLVPSMAGESALKCWAVLPLALDPDYVAPVEPAPYVGLEVDGKPVEIVGYQTPGRLAPARLMPHGATTVAGLLTMGEPWLVAHRGGSASWPEHTQRAYTQAVWAGAHALEISCARTSDGVWIGCHDLTLARLGGPDTPVAQMTWAEVEQAMSGTGNLPARLDWLLERYGHSHVVVFDPKYSASTYMAEYLEMLAPYKDRVILKFSGDSSWLFVEWKRAGLVTWGYGYQAWRTDSPDAWTSLLTDPSKDIISLHGPYSSEAWAEAIAVGKPLTAHILASRTEFDSAVTAGAVGAMVSAIGDWTPDV